jgi:hypothetical protein
MASSFAFAHAAPLPAPGARASRPRAARARHARPGAPPPAASRGWGDTDSRFEKLDKRRDGYDGEGDGGAGGGERGVVDRNGAPRDTERNVSFQELRKRQDRETIREVRKRARSRMPPTH